jgi:hypothetical protein
MLHEICRQDHSETDQSWAGVDAAGTAGAAGTASAAAAAAPMAGCYAERKALLLSSASNAVLVGQTKF